MQADDPKLTSEQAEAKDREAYRWVMDDARGRRVLRALLRWSGIDDTGVLGQVHEMAHAVGKRFIGNLLRAQMRKYHPEGWVRMESEHLQEQLLLADREERQRQRLEENLRASLAPDGAREESMP